MPSNLSDETADDIPSDQGMKMIRPVVDQAAFENLQMQVAFLEDTVSNLDGALAAQQRQLHTLQQQLRLLHGQLKEQGTRLDAMTETPDAPPPHY